MNFGTLLKNSRIARRITLRQCVIELKFDPSDWSKIERSVSPAPKSPETLERWADYLHIHGEDRELFMDLASLSRSQIPPDMASDETVKAALPIFFHFVRDCESRGEIPDKKKLAHLAAWGGRPAREGEGDTLMAGTCETGKSAMADDLKLAGFFEDLRSVLSPSKNHE